MMGNNGQVKQKWNQELRLDELGFLNEVKKKKKKGHPLRVRDMEMTMGIRRLWKECRITFCGL